MFSLSNVSLVVSYFVRDVLLCKCGSFVETKYKMDGVSIVHFLNHMERVPKNI